MAKPTKTATDKTEAPALPPATGSVLGRFLDKHKDEHFNFVEDTSYLVSTGSLNLDAEISGFGPQLVRCVGSSSSGKSSFTLNVAREFVATVPHSKVLYVKSEGRLSSEIQARVGLPFTKVAADWKDGTIFIFECNVYETVISLIRELVVSNPDKQRYMFIIDSMNGLNLRDDMVKTVEQDNRVAGGAKLTSEFLQKMGAAMTKHGHLCFMLSQLRDELKLDPYSKTPPRQVNTTGGHAIQHYSSTVLVFQEWFESDLILENPDEKADRIKNRPRGHTLKVKLAKVDKERRYLTVTIPIKHDVVNGSAIWREREIADQLLGWGLVTKAGSWLKLTDVLKREFADAKLGDIPDQVQGYNQLCTFLESRKNVTDYLFAKLKSMIAAPATTAPKAAA